MKKVKMKTHRGAAKRIRKTGSGKFVHAHGWKSHLLEGKSPSRKRRLRHKVVADRTSRKKLQRLLPYI